MEYLIANLSEWEKINTNSLVNVGSDVKHINKNLYKHYRLTKYLVKDIINVPMVLRWVHPITHYYTQLLAFNSNLH